MQRFLPLRFVALFLPLFFLRQAFHLSAKAVALLAGMLFTLRANLPTTLAHDTALLAAASTTPTTTTTTTTTTKTTATTTTTTTTDENSSPRASSPSHSSPPVSQCSSSSPSPSPSSSPPAASLFSPAELLVLRYRIGRKRLLSAQIAASLQQLVRIAAARGGKK